MCFYRGRNKEDIFITGKPVNCLKNAKQCESFLWSVKRDSRSKTVPNSIKLILELVKLIKLTISVSTAEMERDSARWIGSKLLSGQSCQRSVWGTTSWLSKHSWSWDARWLWYRECHGYMVKCMHPQMHTCKIDLTHILKKSNIVFCFSFLFFLLHCTPY